MNPTHASRPQPLFDGYEPGGLYDTNTVSFIDRLKCFLRGHDVRNWGTIFGWCRRCKHSVHTFDGRSTLYHGDSHSFPPKHDHRDWKATESGRWTCA